MNAVLTLGTPASGLGRGVTKECIVCGCKDAARYLEAPDRFYARPARYELVRCPSCSLVWLENPPLREQMEQHYGREYDEFIRKGTEGQAAKHWHGPRTTVLRHKQHGKLLDLGCGAGSFLKAIKAASWELYGIEISEAAAQKARRSTGAEVFTGDILNAPFAPGSFDVITCFHVFEHLYEPGKVLEKVWKWLKPGGIFCVHVPNIEAAEARVFKSYWYALELPRHLYHFSPTSLRQLAWSTELCEVELTTRRTSFVEYSTRYIFDEFFLRLGLKRPSLALSARPSFSWRLIRKGLRLTMLPLASAIISLKGEGEILEAVFRKPE